MKKFLVLLVVVAMTCMSSMAFAADITMGGTMEIMSRDYDNLDLTKNTTTGDEKRTLQRVRLDMNAKAGSAVGKVTLENDFDTWGRLESNQGTGTLGCDDTNLNGKCDAGEPTIDNTIAGESIGRIKLREAWMLFSIPDTGIFIKGGHMSLALGQGQFLSNMRYGSDAWVMYTDIDTMHFGLVNIKVGEGTNAKSNDDVDAYAFVATKKFGESVAGADISVVKFRNGSEDTLQNLGLNYRGKLGPVALKAELDLQMGDASATTKYKGNLLYVNGAVDMNPVTVNFTLARGTGNKGTTADEEGFQNFLDTNGHYTLIYEYMIETAAGDTLKNTGFVNTTALSLGAMYAATKNLKIGADVWMLSATEKINVNGGTAASDVGTEVDVKVLWKLADNVNWNWTVAYFKPGAIYKNAAGTQGKDAATGI